MNSTPSAGLSLILLSFQFSETMLFAENEGLFKFMSIKTLGRSAPKEG